MLGLLADVNCDLHFNALLAVCRSQAWRTYWLELKVRICSFHSLNLDRCIKDGPLWEICQQQEIVLVTANRNDDGDDSLQATLRRHNTIHSLPVLTIANPNLVLSNAAHARQAAVRMMEILTDIDLARGTGRIYLPSKVEG